MKVETLNTPSVMSPILLGLPPRCERVRILELEPVRDTVSSLRTVSSKPRRVPETHRMPRGQNSAGR
jgi:hypothetical protein